MERNPKNEVKPEVLDELALHTWPAVERQPLGNWLLRASQGVSKRANSVYSSGPMPEGTDWLAAAERFYRDRGLPVRFQVTDSSDPRLEPLLERLGYVVEVRTLLMTGRADTLLQRTAGVGSEWDVSISSVPDDAWIDRFVGFEQYDEGLKNGYEAIFRGLEKDAAFATVRAAGSAIAVGTAVADRGWTGFVNIVTAREHRGKGAAKRIMRELTQWAVHRDAGRLYLQVVADNGPARALYAALGFTPSHGYHYRALQH